MVLSRIVESRAIAVALAGPAAWPSSWLRLALRTGANARSRDWNVLKRTLSNGRLGSKSHLSMGLNV
jgi:hypothetical protein